MGDTRRVGVQFSAGTSGSALLYRILAGAAERHPAVFSGPELLGEPQRFRTSFPERLVQFELRRVASPERAAIARDMLRAAQHELCFAADGRDEPLAEYLARPAEPLPLEELRLLGAGRLTPHIDHQGRSYVGGRVSELADALLQRAHATRAAHRALCWVADRFGADQIDLSGHRFAILGAGAELSPVPLLLEAGADVLWIDLASPPPGLAKDTQLSGRLFFPRGGADILQQPAAIAATLAHFAQPGPLHLGLYAYAPGQGREWRLAGAMNAIVRSLPAGAVESVSFFVSPTSPAVVQEEDQRAAERRLAGAPLWQRALRAAGRLPEGHARRDDVCIARSIVPLQGASYQAAQYLSKLLAAEAWAIYGNDLAGERGAPLRVSANMAAVTRTRSLSTPVFSAAFLGAPAFGVDTLAPDTTRWLNGLLVLHDLLAPEAPGADTAAPVLERARRLHAQQIHGGVCSLPYALNAAITVAALSGFARRPRLLLESLRR